MLTNRGVDLSRFRTTQRIWTFFEKGCGKKIDALIDDNYDSIMKQVVTNDDDGGYTLDVIFTWKECLFIDHSSYEYERFRRKLDILYMEVTDQNQDVSYQDVSYQDVHYPVIDQFIILPLPKLMWINGKSVQFDERVDKYISYYIDVSIIENQLVYNVYALLDVHPIFSNFTYFDMIYIWIYMAKDYDIKTTFVLCNSYCKDDNNLIQGVYSLTGYHILSNLHYNVHCLRTFGFIKYIKIINDILII